MVGTASSGAKAPFGDPSWEIWGVSSRHKHVTRANRWFELHRLDGEDQNWARQWRAALKGFTGDIPELLMLYPEPDLAPKVTQYPYQRIIDRFGSFFNTSSFSWMMGLALDEMVPQGTVAKPGECEIAVYGVDMEYGTEYRHQRVGLRHYIDVARVLGVSVTRLANSGLAYEPVPYPMWQDDPLLCKLELRNKAVRGTLVDRNDAIRHTRELICVTKGGLQEIEMMQKPVPVLEGEDSQPKPYDPNERKMLLAKQLDDLMGTSAQISRDIVANEAIDAEQQWLKGYLQP